MATHNFLPMLAKPLEVIGEQIKVPGDYWEGARGALPAEEASMHYMCTVIEYSALQKFHGGATSVAFQVQEMGETGTGSLEPGVASGEVFWMRYPLPFLTYFYDTFPDKLQ